MMTSTQHTSRFSHEVHSWPARLTVTLLVFLGVTAAAGGLALATGSGAPPEAWLDQVPLVDSWLLPGLVLVLGFGVGSLLTAYGTVSRPSWRMLEPLERVTGHHWSWSATLLLGWGQVAWIGLEVMFLPEYSFLMLVYSLVGLALGVLPLTFHRDLG